jgi:hypothetical protein
MNKYYIITQARVARAFMCCGCRDIKHTNNTFRHIVEWSRALDVRLSEWCCSVTMVWVQIPSREEQTFDSSKI